MTSLKPGAAPAPEEQRAVGAAPRSNVRRTIRLAALNDVRSTPRPRRPLESGGAHRAPHGRGLPTSREDLLVLAERVVGDWAATLHAALLLLLAVCAAIVAVGIVFGVGPALATAFLALLVFLVGRHRGDH